VRALLQRVTCASVQVDERVIGAIDGGWTVLLGVGLADTDAIADRLAQRVANLRAFPDAQGRMNRSLLETGGAALVISQFTLYADTSHGRRPSFTEAAPGDRAAPLVERFIAGLRALGIEVATGEFGAHMVVDLTNDGPVTFLVAQE
jgi:D-tyrosyl-tRNA(Tyr) deacylase